MSSRPQFRLRSIFYVTTVAAVLCLLLPPLFRAARQYLANRAATRQPPMTGLVGHSLVFEEAAPGSADVDEMPEPIGAGSDLAIPTDAAFIQTTIIRVNGKRIDGVEDAASLDAEPDEPRSER
jgi:hypothetical protein